MEKLFRDQDIQVVIVDFDIIRTSHCLVCDVVLCLRSVSITTILLLPQSATHTQICPLQPGNEGDSPTPVHSFPTSVTSCRLISLNLNTR